METLSQRLDACQNKILDCYEKDSKCIIDHINYWKAVRHEYVLYYKARENNINVLNHQMVPSLQVCKAKACSAIELQIALEAISNTIYKNEEWTLRDTCDELWRTEPKNCFKKEGQHIEVWFDGNKNNCMEYVVWKFIYYNGECGWCKVTSGVDYRGIYYMHDGHKTYYTDFEQEAKKYGCTNIWEVHMETESIYCPDSVSSTCRYNVPPVETVNEYNNHRTTTTASTFVGAQDAAVSHRPGKRPRASESEPDSSRESYAHCVTTDTDISNNANSRSPRINTQSHCGDKTTPVIHLKGEANRLKCCRYRFQKYKTLFTDVTTTYHWTSTDNKDSSIITILYKDETQRDTFLNVVKIPPSVQVILGQMSCP